MYKLKLLGWINKEIAELYDLSEGRITQIFSKLNYFNLLKSDFYDKHKPIEELAKYYHLDIPPDLGDHPQEDSAFILGIILNVARRNLPHEQKKEARKHVKKLALALRKTGKSQPEISELLKIPRNDISYWEAEEKGDISNVSTDIAYIPDCRVSMEGKTLVSIGTRVGQLAGKRNLMLVPAGTHISETPSYTRWRVFFLHLLGV